MKNCFDAISTLLAAACAILFVILATLTLVAFIVERTLLSAGVYKQALRDQDVYARMPALVAEQIIYQADRAGEGDSLSPELKRLSQSDWEMLISDIVTPEALQIQAESIVDQFFVYLDTPSMPLRLKVSLADFKASLAGEAGYRAALRIIDAQPDCNTDEWTAFLAAGSYQFEDVPFCRPPDQVMASAEPYIRIALGSLALAIPSEAYLNNPRAAAGASAPADDRRDDLQRARRWINLSLCLPLILIGLVAVFGVRSLAGAGLWLGLPLFFSGVFTFTGALIIWRLPSWLTERGAPYGQLAIDGLAPEFTQTLVDVVTSIAHAAARTVGVVGIVLIVMGLGLLAAGLLFGSARRLSL
jgi:hypothetical protein